MTDCEGFTIQAPGMLQVPRGVQRETSFEVTWGHLGAPRMLSDALAVGSSALVATLTLDEWTSSLLGGPYKESQHLSAGE